MGNGGRLSRPVSGCLQQRRRGMKGILQRGHSRALSSIPIPHPSFSSPWTLTRSEASGPNKAPTLCSLSSLSPDSCRLLTSSTWRQWRERGTGADWCLPICQWRFLPPRPLPASFSPPSQTKLCIQSAAPTPHFSSNTDGECGERPAIYRWVDIRTRCTEKTATYAGREKSRRCE